MAETSMVEKVARALQEAALGYNMSLVRLVDGVSTYRLTYSDGEVLEFDNTDDLYLHVEEKKRRTQARAAIEAMREPTDEMVEAGRENNFNRYATPAWHAMIDAALNGKEG